MLEKSYDIWNASVTSHHESSARLDIDVRLCDFLRDLLLFFSQSDARQTADWPAEDTENKVEHEERSNDDETDEVDPRPAVTQRVIDLHIHKRHRRCCKLTKKA